MAIEKTIFKVKEPLDHFTSSNIENKIFEAIKSGHTNIVLDFGFLTYIDSGGIGVIIKTLKRLRELDGLLEITGVNSDIKRIFEISAIDKIVPVETLRIEYKANGTISLARETPPRKTHFNKKIAIQASPRYLNKIRRQILLMMTDLGFSEALTYDIVVAVSEACSNSIEHGSLSKKHSIFVIFDYSLGQLTIDVIDSGSGFDEIEAMDRQIDDPTRGRGITLIRELMDEVKFLKNDRGFTVKMKKKV